MRFLRFPFPAYPRVRNTDRPPKPAKSMAPGPAADSKAQINTSSRSDPRLRPRPHAVAWYRTWLPHLFSPVLTLIFPKWKFRNFHFPDFVRPHSIPGSSVLVDAYTCVRSQQNDRSAATFLLARRRSSSKIPNILQDWGGRLVRQNF